MSENFLKPYIARRKDKGMNLSRGFTFIDILIGMALMLIVFVSLVGVFRMSIGVIVQSKARVGALALVQERVEFLRSLSYDEVATENGIPEGSLKQEEAITLNGILYERRTFVQYVDAPQDGTGNDDENNVPTDYKVAKVEVSWTVSGVEKSVAAVTNVMPPGIETNEGGGTLIIEVFDALSSPVQGATVHIVNTNIAPAVDVEVSTNENGRVMFPGSPSANDYEMTVTKNGYNSAQTRDVTAELPVPLPGHVSVLEGETTEVSFAIDLLGSLRIDTWLPILPYVWEDTMDTTAQMQFFNQIALSFGSVALGDSGHGYYTNGSIMSEDITHTYLDSWDAFSWSDTTPPGTTILYHVYDADTDTRIPDVVLPGNAAGFSSSPVSLSLLAPETYTTLSVEALFETSATSTTPALHEWSVSYEAGPIPVGDVPFSLSGTKSIGFDGEGEPVLAYDTNQVTDANGNIVIDLLTWDTYTVIVDDDASGYDVRALCPEAPFGVDPGENEEVDIYLAPDTQHSLRVIVYTTEPAPAAGVDVELSRSGFSAEETTDSCGQAFFADLVSSSNYVLSVDDSPFGTGTVSDVSVDGVSFEEVWLE